MSVSYQRTLPGINPGSRNYQTFTDTFVDGTQDINIGPATSADPLDQPLSSLAHGMFRCTPTADRTWTLPAPTTIVANLTQFTNINIADGFQFIVRNLSAPGVGFDIILSVAAGITADSEANLIIQPGQYSTFILHCDDPNPTTPSFEIFQVDSGIVATPGPAYLSAEATTIDAMNDTTIAVAGTPVVFEGLTFTVGAAPVAPAQGITLTGPVSTSTTFTVANAGIYNVSVSVSADITATSDATVFVLVAVAATPVVQQVCGLGNGDAAEEPHGDGAGSIILALADGAVLSLFLDTDTSGSVVAANQVAVTIVRIA